MNRVKRVRELSNDAQYGARKWQEFDCAHLARRESVQLRGLRRAESAGVWPRPPPYNHYFIPLYYYQYSTTTTLCVLSDTRSSHLLFLFFSPFYYQTYVMPIFEAYIKFRVMIQEGKVSYKEEWRLTKVFLSVTTLYYCQYSNKFATSQLSQN